MNVRRLLLIFVFCTVFITCKDKDNEKLTLQPGSGIEPIISEQESESEAEPQPEEASTEADLNAAAFIVSTQVPIQRTLPDLQGIGGRVNTREIDPINYENPDLDILRQMGTQQYVISYLEGEQLYKAGDYDKALSEFTSSINSNTEFIEAIIYRGNTWLRKKEYSRAIDDYSRAIRLDGNRAELFNYRGFARMELAAETAQNSAREYNLAIEDFSRAILLYPNYIDALINRSYAFYRINDFDRVIEDCNRIIALEPHNAYIWNRRGSAYYSKRDDNSAINDFSEAIRIRSDYAAALYNRGNAFYSMGEHVKALADIDSTLAVNPLYPEAAALREKILRMIR